MAMRPHLPDLPDFALIRGRHGHDVVRVRTPSGVVGYIGADIPPEVLEAFGKKLARKLARTNRRLASQLLK